MGIASYSGASSVIKPGVVTSSTRPSSPFVGQLIYETDTARVAAYNGSAWVGVGSFVPIVPTSVTVSGGTGTFNSSTGTVTATGVTTVILNGVFSSTYKVYRIVVHGGSTTESLLRMRLSVGGTESTATNYNFAAPRNAYSTGNFGAYATGVSQSYFNLGDLAISGTEVTNATMIDINSPFQTAYTSYTMTSSDGVYFYVGGGSFNATTSFDGVQFLPSTSPMTATINVYGYAI
jgi:hypothetical protein